MPLDAIGTRPIAIFASWEDAYTVCGTQCLTGAWQKCWRFDEIQLPNPPMVQVFFDLALISPTVQWLKCDTKVLCRTGCSLMAAGVIRITCDTGLWVKHFGGNCQPGVPFLDDTCWPTFHVSHGVSTFNSTDNSTLEPLKNTPADGLKTRIRLTHNREPIPQPVFHVMGPSGTFDGWISH